MTTILEDLYKSIRDIPYNEDSEGLKIIGSKSNPRIKKVKLAAEKRERYRRGWESRLDIWENEILPRYYGMEIEDEYSLKSKACNNVFLSKIKVKNETENLKVWTPWAQL